MRHRRAQEGKATRRAGRFAASACRRVAPAAIWLLALGATPAQNELPDLDLLPEGAGRMETYTFCGSCHSLHIVAGQRLSRADWEDVLHAMRDEGMAELPPAIRRTILDYLATNLGRSRDASKSAQPRA